MTPGGQRLVTDANYDDSNWMAIVDLVQASELQLVYTPALQARFTQGSESFFTDLEHLAEDGSSQDSSNEASGIRELIDSFIASTKSVFDEYKAEVKASF